eukprot:gb/GECG01006229.1/.p1 GENE.gb/GECG01006229.1/~~gb/GECG01006229.1/.p1  ORF type:complete len:359 (+),score=48.38 gb/GECG01006229.1/:1-1077(+)
MAGEELSEQFGKWVCCKVLCPPWDCQQTVVPEQVNEEVAWVDKPAKWAIYCCLLPWPCIGCCYLALGCSIDIHSVDEMGRLKIRHHYPCSYQEEEHEDVVGVNWTNEYIDSKQNEIRNFGGMTSSVEEAKEAVNDFLKARRERNGVRLQDDEARNALQKLEMKSLHDQPEQETQSPEEEASQYMQKMRVSEKREHPGDDPAGTPQVQVHQGEAPAGWQESPIMQASAAQGQFVNPHSAHVPAGIPQVPPQGAMLTPQQQQWHQAAMMQAQMQPQTHPPQPQYMMYPSVPQQQYVMQQYPFAYPPPAQWTQALQQSAVDGGQPPQYEPARMPSSSSDPNGQGEQHPQYHSYTKSAYSPG